MIQDDITDKLRQCFQLRREDPTLLACDVYRLFNGFYEGLPGLVIDRYATAIVISNHSRQPESLEGTIDQIVKFNLTEVPWVKSILLKTRHPNDPEKRKGRLLHGQELPQEISENGIRYAIDLRLNQDDSFYPDTRNLRGWLALNSQGKSVLNCFAYTGSLGIAALAGGAGEVIQTDSNRDYLNLAEQSSLLNQLPGDLRLWKSDFFKAIARLKQARSLYDIVILDAPFFSQSPFGEVDLQKESTSLINKARPLVAHDGKLIVINNALYVSGKQFLQEIEDLCKTGYVSIESMIEIPTDITGYPETIIIKPPVDPAPFNHPTKICILKVLRKDQKVANF